MRITSCQGSDIKGSAPCRGVFKQLTTFPYGAGSSGRSQLPKSLLLETAEITLSLALSFFAYKTSLILILCSACVPLISIGGAWSKNLRTSTQMYPTWLEIGRLRNFHLCVPLIASLSACGEIYQCSSSNPIDAAAQSFEKLWGSVQRVSDVRKSEATRQCSKGLLVG